MGISKLTTYMEDKESGPGGAIWDHMNLKALPESRLVIDGNSLCLWLYRSNENLQATACMGGSYPEFYEMVVCFFETLTNDYRVHPIVVFDGIKRDNETSQQRRSKYLVSTAKYQSRIYRGFHGLPAPLMTKEVFLDALQDEGVPSTDIHFVHGEADPEIVAIANSFGCPVLSNDSDFYIYNVTGGYIPLSSLKISDDCKLLSPEVDVFAVDRFTQQFKLQDEALRFLLPAVLGNDYITTALATFPELQLHASSDSGIVLGVIHYANRFASFHKCLAAASTNPSLLNNLKQAQKQYENIPPPSYPQAPPSGVPGDFLRLQQQYHDRFRQGCFQTFMAEASVNGQCIFRSVFDDIKLTGSQSTSLPIRRAIYHILGCQSPVCELRRGARTELVHIEVQFSGQPPITADNIARSSPQERQSILLSVLQCDQALIAQLPEEWQLPMAATMYWFAQSHCKPVTKALIACFVACHDPQIYPIPSQDDEFKPPTDGTPELERVHYLAQWQCVYFDVAALNQLLMEPFQYVSPAKLFDGVVAAQFVYKSIDKMLQSQGFSVDLYHNLLRTIVPERPPKHKPAKKAAACKGQPFTQNRFAILAKMKDRKE